MQPDHNHRIIKQLLMLERSLRSLRAELESSLADPRPSKHTGLGKRIETPLTTLLNTATSLPARALRPYEGLFPGVHFAYPAANVIELSAETRGFRFPTEGIDQPDSGASCLIARIRRKPSDEGGWATLETELDPQTLLGLSQLELRLMLSFRTHSLSPLGNFRLFLRWFNEQGRFEDMGLKAFPALELPIEFSYRLEAEQLAQIPRTGVNKARLILGLPMSADADYSAILSCFELTG